MTTQRKLLFLPLAAILIVLFQNCGQRDGTDTGDPGLQLEFSAYDSNQAWLDHLIPKAFASVSSISTCIHQIRFKASADDNSQNTNVDGTGEAITWSPSGTALPEVDVSPGLYRRIDVMVRDTCGTGHSVSLQNDNGSFASQQPVILRFTGEIVVGVSDGVTLLNVVPFVEAFNQVNSDSDLQAVFTTEVGDF